MNDYSIGAIEALSWARLIVKKSGEKAGEDAAQQIELMIMKLTVGAAISFRDKVDMIKEL